MKNETLKINTINGETTAYVAMPDEIEADSKAVILIQEYWGLNDHIKDIAGRYADEGFICIAPDLYRGRIATNPDDAAQMMKGLELEEGLDTIKNAQAAAREKYGISHFGITGFCMGGTYALQAVCHLEGFSASAPFYGDTPDEDVLQNLKTPVLFISGTKDNWINPEKVAGLERAAQVHNLPIESVKYEADHAFFNDTRDVYDKDAAEDAWAKVISFFDENL